MDLSFCFAKKLCLEFADGSGQAASARRRSSGAQSPGRYSFEEEQVYWVSGRASVWRITWLTCALELDKTRQGTSPECRGNPTA